jgi:hypothetical protein
MVGDSLDYINETWQRDVLPQCQAALGDRYPLSATAQDEVSLRDFSDMFRPGGVLDEFFQKNLAPFVVEERNGFVPAQVDGTPLPLRRPALAQFARARAIRTAFFGTATAPALKFSLTPSFLDARLLRATLTIDGREITYRHEATRAYDIEWPTKTAASTVSVTLTDLDGKETRIERSGAWALLRLVDAASLSARGGADHRPRDRRDRLRGPLREAVEIGQAVIDPDLAAPLAGVEDPPDIGHHALGRVRRATRHAGPLQPFEQAAHRPLPVFPGIPSAVSAQARRVDPASLAPAARLRACRACPLGTG